MKPGWRFLILFLAGLFLLTQTQSTQAQAPTPGPVVRTVLFYRSACSHCQMLVEEVIPPLDEKYGQQLQIFGIDVSQPEGDALYDAAIAQFNIRKFGVPTLIVADQVLVGSVEIQQRFPDLVEGYLGQGGVDWPKFPGLNEALSAALPTAPPSLDSRLEPRMSAPDESLASVGPTPMPGIILSGDQINDPVGNFALDPFGNSLAVVVLLGMVASILCGINFFRSSCNLIPLTAPGQLIPGLCLLGLGVASYLAYVELTQATAVCGPVGDCNTVQQSEYARLFGFLPIGVLGLAGYVMILLAWGVQRLARQPLAAYASLAILGMTSFGVLFSIYLTFLEPFVIGATCAWCLTSAVVMTALFWLSLAPARPALPSLFHGEKYTLKRSGS